MALDEKANYYDAGGIEVISVIRAKLTPEQLKGYFLGNVIKYSCRLNFKNNDGGARDAEKCWKYNELLKVHIEDMEADKKYQEEKQTASLSLTEKISDFENELYELLKENKFNIEKILTAFYKVFVHDRPQEKEQTIFEEEFNRMNTAIREIHAVLNHQVTDPYVRLHNIRMIISKFIPFSYASKTKKES